MPRGVAMGCQTDLAFTVAKQPKSLFYEGMDQAAFLATDKGKVEQNDVRPSKRRKLRYEHF